MIQHRRGGIDDRQSSPAIRGRRRLAAIAGRCSGLVRPPVLWHRSAARLRLGRGVAGRAAGQRETVRPAADVSQPRAGHDSCLRQGPKPDIGRLHVASPRAHQATSGEYDVAHFYPLSRMAAGGRCGSAAWLENVPVDARDLHPVLVLDDDAQERFPVDEVNRGRGWKGEGTAGGGKRSESPKKNARRAKPGGHRSAVHKRGRAAPPDQNDWL